MLNLNELKAERIRFRLLNSEIGNDQKSMEMIKKAFRGFRLLNSEIGNDLNEEIEIEDIEEFCFRLLNSEIGNDHCHQDAQS